ncbi:histone-fold-containing protein [Paraphysoderma sedebokerense]|nr:histone-fold-containing protein [Paraphysoderma sedebokerense]
MTAPSLPLFKQADSPSHHSHSQMDKSQQQSSPAHNMSSPSIQVPISKVKKIMKEDKDVSIVSGDAVFLVAASTEIMIEQLMQKAYEYTRRDNRKTLQYKDIANAVKNVDGLEFLMDTIPMTLPLKEALQAQKEIMEANMD